jgi:hypothetical protein
MKAAIEGSDKDEGLDDDAPDNSFPTKKRMTTRMTATIMEIRSPNVSDDKDSKNDADSMDAVDNALKEDAFEPEIDEDDHEAGLNHFKVEDLDDHRRKWQAYLAEKEVLHSSN